MADNLKNMSMEIIVDDGSRRVPIRNTQGEEIGEFRFHPTDIGIIDRYNALAARFEEISEPLERLAGGAGGEIDLTDAKYTEALQEAEKRLLAAVDELLNSEGSAAAFFGKMNPFSPVDGEFYCARVLTALGQYIGAQFERETAQLSAKARKYAKKATK